LHTPLLEREEKVQVYFLVDKKRGRYELKHTSCGGGGEILKLSSTSTRFSPSLNQKIGVGRRRVNFMQVEEKKALIMKGSSRR